MRPELVREKKQVNHADFHNILTYVHTHTHTPSAEYVRIQWNLSIEETIGTQLAILYTEVFLIQR